MILGHPIFLASSELGLLFTIFRLLGTPKTQNYPEIASFKDFSPSYPKFLGEGIRLEGVPKVVEELLISLLSVNPDQRICAEEALRHEFLAGGEGS